MHSKDSKINNIE